MIRPVVKRTYQPTRVEMLPLAMRQATDTMLHGRPGPVQLDVPFNLFQETSDVELDHGEPARLGSRRTGASPDHVAQGMDMILSAQRPVFFISHGVVLSEGSAELTELARRLSIPVISSPNGMGALDMNDPLSLGFIGRNGAYAANEGGRRADLVIAIGARFDDRSSSTWMPGYSWNFPTTKLIQIDVDQAEVGRNYAPDLAIVADAKTVLGQLLHELETRNVQKAPRLQPWLKLLTDAAKEWSDFVAPRFSEHAKPIRPERIVADCQAVIPEDATVTFDAGIHHNWFMQFWKARYPAQMLNSWGFSGMGFGPSAALGAKLAEPDRPVISVSGDGGFTMVPHVLCTAVEYNIPVVWIVWNNFAWGAIRDIQHGIFNGREIGTGFYHGENNEPYNPDFAAWARAACVQATTVTRSEDFAAALDHAIKANVPYLIDVRVDADIKPPATGAWHLPPVPYHEPAFGKRYLPEKV